MVEQENKYNITPELLINIFEFEPEVGSFIKLQLTCRRVFLYFKHYSKDGKVECLRHVDKAKQIMSSSFLRRLCQRRIGNAMKSLDLSFTLLTDDHFGKAVLPKSLKELKLNACRELTEKTLVQIGDQCPELNRIDLYWNCVISDFGIKRLSKCTKLDYVNLSGCKYLSDSSINHLTENCPDISVLNLTRMEGITDKSIEYISDRTPKLKELYLYACAQISDKAFKYLSESEITKLELLEVCGCADLKDDTFAAICARNPSLHSINLTWCT